jgi:multiple sugar transport system permease protein
MTAQTRTLISSAQLNRGRGKIIYRVVLTLVIVVFTIVFIGPLYFLFTDGPQLGQRVGGKAIFALMLMTLMIPATVLVVPQYITVANLPILHMNLIGTPEAIWLPSVANAFSIFLLKRFFDSIPDELLAAAAIDGASPMRTLRSVVLPISRPILGVVSIFALVTVWKDFLWPLLVENNYQPSRETLNVGIWQAAQAAPQNIVLAASAVAAIPTLIFFLIFQRNIMSGLTAGSLKG